MTKPQKGAEAPVTRDAIEQSGEASKGETSDAQERRRRFAQALARSAFGRFYWDERQEAEMRRAMKRPKADSKA